MKNTTIKINEEDIQKMVNECVKKIISERDYYDIAKRTEPKSEEEYREWINKKSAAKKKYFDSLKKDNKPNDSKAIDYYDYKHGEHPEMTK